MTAEPPVSVPLLGLVPIARLIVVELSPVSTLPLASSTATVTTGEIAEPAAVLLGPWMKPKWVAAPGVMLNGDETAEVYEGVLEALRVYPAPIKSMDRLENVAMPEATVTAEPPVKVPPLGLVPMARTTWVALSPVSMLLLPSSTATVTAGEMAEPACALLGPWMKARCVATPGVIVKAGDVAAASDGVLDAMRV